MLIAFACSVTLVPAMLMVLKPPGETAPVGFKRLAPVDDFLQRHRIALIACTFIVVLAGSPLLFHLSFDFNPVDLQDPNSPSVVTYRQLQNDPQTASNDAEVLAPLTTRRAGTQQSPPRLPGGGGPFSWAPFAPE